MFNKKYEREGIVLNPLISIIIPIYNVEKYLNKCIESVLNQSFKNIEIILVNDGSQDGCLNICREYEEQDKRIRVIDKENSGASEARNVGIKASRGDYIMFLDSDDYWEGKEALNNIVNKLYKSPDVLIYGCKDHNLINHKKVISRSNYNIEYIENSSKCEMLTYLFQKGLFPGSVWLTVVKRKLILKYNIFFIKGIKGEDYDWLLNVFLHANKFTAINDTFYVYLKYRSDSITGTGDIESIKGLLFTIEKWYSLLLKEKDIILQQILLNYLAYIMGTTFVIYGNLSKEEKNIARDMIAKNSFILAYGTNVKVKFINFCNKLMGIDITAFICNQFYQRKKKYD